MKSCSVLLCLCFGAFTKVCSGQVPGTSTMDVAIKPTPGNNSQTLTITNQHQANLVALHVTFTCSASISNQSSEYLFDTRVMPAQVSIPEAGSLLVPIPPPETSCPYTLDSVQFADGLLQGTAAGKIQAANRERAFVEEMTFWQEEAQQNPSPISTDEMLDAVASKHLAALISHSGYDRQERTFREMLTHVISLNGSSGEGSGMPTVSPDVRVRAFVSPFLLHFCAHTKEQ